MKVLDYRVAYGTDVASIEAEVMHYVAQGYVPHGSLVGVGGALGMSWAQAMVLTQPEIGDPSD